MTRDQRPTHILLIEDNPGDALLVEEFLNEAFKNAKLTHVTTLEKGSELLNNEQEFDAILLDLSLPDSDGMNLVDTILNLAGTIPVIILTGYTNLEFSRRSLSKGVSDYLLKDELSSTLLFKTIVYSIERNVFSRKLKKSEQNYRHLFEFSPVPMMVYDLNTLSFLDVNKAAIQHYGYSKEEFLKMTLHDIRPPETKEDLNKALKSVRLHPDESNVVIAKHQKKSGEIIQVEVEGSSIEYKDREARLVLAVDITEKLKEEQRLKQLESVITNTTEFVVILENDLESELGQILYVNDAFTDMTHYKREEVLGKSLDILYGEKTDSHVVEKLHEAMKNQEICNVEFINYRKDGTSFWVHTSLVPVTDIDGNHTQWAAMGRDISKQKVYQKELEDSLDEKQVLLSEIHHRVKNNLAIVSSMMQLQAFSSQDEALKKRLYDSVFRISTMATIHEILYQSGSFSRLNFSDIIEKLIDNLELVLGKNKNIEHRIEKLPIELNINQAIPCSLLVNEVVTNVYKHAFEGKDGGILSVTLAYEENEVFVKISDNGIGLPQNLDPEESDSLGLHLIKVLTKQLNGKSELKNTENGTEFKLRFNKSDVAGIGSSKVK